MGHQGCADDGDLRGEWLTKGQAAQCALLVQLITWVQLVETAFTDQQARVMKQEHFRDPAVVFATVVGFCYHRSELL